MTAKLIKYACNHYRTTLKARGRIHITLCKMMTMYLDGSIDEFMMHSDKCLEYNGEYTKNKIQ